MITRRLALAALPLLAAAPASAQNQPPPMFSAADEAAVKAVVNRYFAAFTAKDYAAFREVFHVPYLLRLKGELTLLAAPEEVDANYKSIRDYLDGQDYSVSKAAEIRVRPLHANQAFADVLWQRLKRDGSLLGEGAEVMIVTRYGDRWLISGVLPEDIRQYRTGR